MPCEVNGQKRWVIVYLRVDPLNYCTLEANCTQATVCIQDIMNCIF